MLGTLTAEHSISWKIVPRGVQHQFGVAAVMSKLRLFLAIVASMVGINISWRATAEFGEDVTAQMHRQGAITPITSPIRARHTRLRRGTANASVADVGKTAAP